MWDIPFETKQRARSVGIKCYPFNSHELPRQNFSSKYPYNIKYTRGEKEEKYQLGDYQLIQCQVLRTKIIRIVWQTLERITDEILRAEGLCSRSLLSYQEGALIKYRGGGGGLDKSTARFSGESGGGNSRLLQSIKGVV